MVRIGLGAVLMSGIQMTLFGGGGPVIQLSSPVLISYASGGVTPATTGYGLYTDGYVYNQIGSFAPPFTSTGYQWDNIASTVGNYEARATYTGGGTIPAQSTGTMGSWTSLASNLSWSIISPTGNYRTGTMTIEIRDASSTSVRATATVTLESDAT